MSWILHSFKGQKEDYKDHGFQSRCWQCAVLPIFVIVQRRKRKTCSLIYSKTLISLSINLEMLNNFKNAKSDRDDHLLLLKPGYIFNLPCSISITIQTILFISYIKTIILFMWYLYIPTSILESSETFILWMMTVK